MKRGKGRDYKGRDQRIREGREGIRFIIGVQRVLNSICIDLTRNLSHSEKDSKKVPNDKAGICGYN